MIRKLVATALLGGIVVAGTAGAASASPIPQHRKAGVVLGVRKAGIALPRGVVLGKGSTWL